VTFEARRRPGFGKWLQVKNILKEIDLANEHYNELILFYAVIHRAHQWLLAVMGERGR
jgi:hypothetical protein